MINYRISDIMGKELRQGIEPHCGPEPSEQKRNGSMLLYHEMITLDLNPRRIRTLMLA